MCAPQDRFWRGTLGEAGDLDQAAAIEEAFLLILLISEDQSDSELCEHQKPPTSTYLKPLTHFLQITDLQTWPLHR